MKFSDQFRSFALERDVDESGVSGTGRVAVGIRFSSGKCVLHWLTGPVSSIGVYDTLDDLVRIHGHKGKTRLVWLS